MAFSHRFRLYLATAGFLTTTCLPIFAQQTPTIPTPVSAIPASPLSDEVARQMMARFEKEKLKAGDFAFTLLDLSTPQPSLRASYRADTLIYPASVVKLFYLVAAQSWLERGQMSDSPELRRAFRDMIVDSNNDATALILDMLTGTTSGPELPPAELAAWGEKRNAVNRYFTGLGFSGINVNQKPWNEGPYGRERQFLGPNFENRNKLTTAATAQLLAQVAQGQAVSPARSGQMNELLERDPHVKEGTASQLTGFIGSAIRDIPDSMQWSKAGLTYNTRHDAAYVELPVSAQFPQGARFVLVIFTTDHANQTQILPAMARLLIDRSFGKDADKNAATPQ